MTNTRNRSVRAVEASGGAPDGKGMATPTPDQRPARVLYEISAVANSHGHLLRVVEVEFPDGTGLYVDVSEPGKCGCWRRVALSEVVHLLINISEPEMWAIPNRNYDPAGHEHPVVEPSAG